LQKLEFDLEEIAFAHVPGLVARTADIDGFLEAVEILPGKIERGLCKQGGDELRRDIEGELAFVVSHLRAGDGRLVFGGLQTMLAFFPAFKRVADAQIKLSIVFQIVRVELAGIEKREELRIPGNGGIGAEVGGGFLGLILQDGRTRGEQSVIVLERETQRFFKRNARGGLLLGGGSRRLAGSGRRLLGSQERWCREQGKYPYDSFLHVKTSDASRCETGSGSD